MQAISVPPVAFALVVILPFAFTPLATAQTPTGPGFSEVSSDTTTSMGPSQVVVETLDDQLVRLLKTGDPNRQTVAMQIIISYNQRKPRIYDFTSCISPLVKVYRSDQKEGVRLLALAALHSIGAPSVYVALRKFNDQEHSERVRRQTALILKAVSGESTS
jgi:hypothetical protein